MARLDVDKVIPLIEVADTPTIHADDIGRVDIIGNKIVLIACTEQVAPDGSHEWPVAGRLALQINAIPGLLQKIATLAASTGMAQAVFKPKLVN